MTSDQHVLEKAIAVLRENEHLHLALKTDGHIVKIFDIHRLWKLAEHLPVTERHVSEFDLATAFPWFLTNAPPTVAEIIDHMRRIMRAELDYPVMLDANGGVLDGIHRIAKCVIEDIPVVKCVQFSEGPVPDWQIE